MRILNLEAAEICFYILIKTTYWSFITTKMKLMLSVPSVCTSNIGGFFFPLNFFMVLIFNSCYGLLIHIIQDKL